jgi:hypothetical protein
MAPLLGKGLLNSSCLSCRPAILHILFSSGSKQDRQDEEMILLPKCEPCRESFLQYNITFLPSPTYIILKKFVDIGCQDRYVKDMMTPPELEEAFGEFSNNLPKHAPDGVLVVDLNLLQELGLLQHEKFAHSQSHADLMHYFHVLETADKVTLFNEQFAVWILPQVVHEIPLTLTFVARLQQKAKPNLELVFSTSGVYNTPRFILKILEHFLTEVIDTESLLSQINRPKQ